MSKPASSTTAATVSSVPAKRQAVSKSGPSDGKTIIAEGSQQSNGLTITSADKQSRKRGLEEQPQEIKKSDKASRVIVKPKKKEEEDSSAKEVSVKAKNRKARRAGKAETAPDGEEEEAKNNVESGEAEEKGEGEDEEGDGENDEDGEGENEDDEDGEGENENDEDGEGENEDDDDDEEEEDEDDEEEEEEEKRKKQRKKEKKLRQFHKFMVKQEEVKQQQKVQLRRMREAVDAASMKRNIWTLGGDPEFALDREGMEEFYRCISHPSVTMGADCYRQLHITMAQRMIENFRELELKSQELDEREKQLASLVNDSKQQFHAPNPSKLQFESQARPYMGLPQQQQPSPTTGGLFANLTGGNANFTGSGPAAEMLMMMMASKANGGNGLPASFRPSAGGVILSELHDKKEPQSNGQPVAKPSSQPQQPAASTIKAGVSSATTPATAAPATVSEDDG